MTIVALLLYPDLGLGLHEDGQWRSSLARSDLVLSSTETWEPRCFTSMCSIHSGYLYTVSSRDLLRGIIFLVYQVLLCTEATPATLVSGEDQSLKSERQPRVCHVGDLISAPSISSPHFDSV